MTDTDAKPIVWALCTGTWGGGRDQAWQAFTDDGEFVTSHISSSREWGIFDVGPGNWKREAYERVVGTADPEQVDYRVIPEGDDLPHEVIERGIANGHLRRPGESSDEVDAS